jgi:hypothetical protein
VGFTDKVFLWKSSIDFRWRRHGSRVAHHASHPIFACGVLVTSIDQQVSKPCTTFVLCSFDFSAAVAVVISLSLSQKLIIDQD